MDYLSWNDLIAGHFFRPEMAGRRVYLYVTEELLGEIGTRNADVGNFVDAVKVGPPGLTRQGLCQRALQTMQDWRSKGLPFPPYVAYLALFVLAAGKEGDFAPHAYYPRLRTLLGEKPRAGHYASFEHMVQLWDDLERWSNSDKAGELGIFYNSIAGSWFHVGIPIAQTLLTEHERAALPQIFARTAMDPGAPPSDEELALLVRRAGQHELRPRTLLSLLGKKDGSDDDLRGVLIETIIEELREWDGVALTEPFQSSTSNPLNGTLRLCCKLDEIAGTANCTLRCSTKHDFPADGLLLDCESLRDQFTCEEYGLGWSTPLEKQSDGALLDAALFDWSVDLVMTDAGQGWLLRLPSGPVRVFVSGGPQGIDGLVEVRRLPQSTKFYVATRKDSYEAVKAWGEEACRGFTDLEITHGLPKGWFLSCADAALNDDSVRKKYPMLALPVTTRLFLRGGIRVSQGNQFFKFASPCVELEGPSDSVEIYCDGVALKFNDRVGCYELPQNLPSGSQVIVEASRGHEALKKLSFYLEEDFPAVIAGSEKLFDRFGLEVSEPNSGGGTIAGTSVQGIDFPSFDFNSALQRAGDEPIFYLGRVPGQVITYPSEPLSDDWSPIWEIRIRRTGKVEYCGTSLSNSEPTEPTEGVDRKKLQLWKDLVWHRRKRITGPSTAGLRNLWRRYQESARHV